MIHHIFACLLLFCSLTLGAQDAVMSFENLTTNLNCTTTACQYVDPDDPLVAHPLVDANGVPVNSPSMGSIIGFNSFFTPTRTGSSNTGLTDGDVFGYAGPVVLADRLPGATATDGSQVFFIQDTDGQARLEFEQVEVGVGTQFSMDFYIDEGTYEISTGANDRFLAFIDVAGCATPATVTLLDTDGGGPGGGGGNDIDEQSIEGSWMTLSADLTPYLGCAARLIVEADFNSNSEEMAIDNIRFTNATVLPVEWLSFTARATASGAELAWETAAETDNRGFHVERSADGRDFETIGWVAGRGDSDARQAYSFADRQPLSGNNYYRLQQQDFDGATDYSEVKMLNFEVAKPSTVSIVPNPFSGRLTLLNNEPFATSQVLLLDVNGRLMVTAQVTEGQTELSLDTSQLPAGVYLLRMGDEVRRVVKR